MPRNGADGIREAFDRSIEAPLVLDPQAPLDIARAFITRSYMLNGVATLHCQNATFFAYSGTHYREIAQIDMKAALYRFLDGAMKRGADGKPEPFKPTARKVSEALDALQAQANLSGTIRPPAWLGEAVDLSADEMIACGNGLLHLPSGRLLPHTPAFFVHNALDYDYRPDAPQPARWLAFLAQLWPDDRGSIETLQEMAGLFLTGDTGQQKAFLLIGPPRSGKGTIVRVLSRLPGPDSVCGPTLSGLAQNFGLANLIGKRLAIISDARLGARVDQHIIAERLLSITGEDAIDVPRKFLADWNGRLQVRFLILSNELPRLTDASGALASRFIVLVLTQSFLGREDHGLVDRLLPELPGILNWAVIGWRRLNERGYFLQPESASEAAQELYDLVSPIGVFLRERCIVEPGRSVVTGLLFNAWCDWCKDHGREHPGTMESFGQWLRAAVPTLRKSRPRDDAGVRQWTYEGVGIMR